MKDWALWGWGFRQIKDDRGNNIIESYWDWKREGK